MAQVSYLETSPPKISKKGQKKAPGDAEALTHLHEAMRDGTHWYIALLEAMALWDSSEETYQGRHYRYLIANEAFDWLLLAERLCETVDGYIPQEEKLAFLFHGRPPIELDPREFHHIIGSAKHRAYLNYVYGVMVEEALILAVEEDIYKEHRAWGYDGKGALESAYHRIYGADQEELLGRFREERGYPERETITLGELKEFTYWLFKHRLGCCDGARVASDTRKGLGKLRELWSIPRVLAQTPVESFSYGTV